ncbi:hypothetical protein MMC28_004635 [Mycoblastus sanguinarius]|nr:hypothetical protein [Mycoblastus sanguinarius]
MALIRNLQQSYWSKRDGNGTAIWADAHLTEKGAKQAQKANAFWANEIATQEIPLPESGLQLPDHHSFIPEVKELVREVIGIHTCDRRSSKTYIQTNFPNYTFEPGFSENDELWRPDFRENHSSHDVRMEKLLDDVFAKDDSTYISFSSHSGSIASILRVIGHRPFSLVTGAVIPVLVKAETIEGSTHEAISQKP